MSSSPLALNEAAYAKFEAVQLELEKSKRGSRKEARLLSERIDAVAQCGVSFDALWRTFLERQQIKPNPAALEYAIF